jgi:fructose-bisphosphate aldolase, class I
LSHNGLATTARALVAPGTGILAADESTATMTKRLEGVGVISTPDTRLAFRELLLTTRGISDHVSGVILYDETLRQYASDGSPIPALLELLGIIPGIKVDTGVKPLAGAPGETVTEGLDHLRDRLADYRDLGARFAKWRATYAIDADLPSTYAIEANAHALARYAALCQEAGVVPIVEPEVLMDGDHTIERCEDVTTAVLEAVFAELRIQRVALEGIVLKPNMVLAGSASPEQPDVVDVAAATLRTLHRTVPAAVPGIAFLSGGQSDDQATTHLDAMNRITNLPWEITFSFGRALVATPLATWRGDRTNHDAAQAAFLERVRATGAARQGALLELV